MAQNFTLTDITEIASEIEQKLKQYEDTLEELAELTTKFTDTFDRSLLTNFNDATVLKKRMKDRIIKAVNDDI